MSKSIDGKIIYHEKYKKDAAVIKKDNLPTLHHLNDGFIVTGARIIGAGIMEYPDGTKKEFNDIRVIMEVNA